MELIDHRIKLKSWRDPIWWHHITDLHRAAVGCDVRQWKSDIARIAAARDAGEVHLVTLGGDMVNAIPHTDKRYDATAVRSEFQNKDNVVQLEAEAVARECEIIRDCIVGAGEGNHESSTKRKGEFDPTRLIASALKVPHMGYSAVIRLTINYEDTDHVSTVVIYWHHGFGASRSMGSKLNMLYSLREIVLADVYLSGHVHQPVLMPTARMSISRKGTLRLMEKDVLFVNGGSYLKGHPVIAPQKGGTFDPDHHVTPDYGERAGYTPAVIGHMGFSIQTVRTSKAKQDWQTKLRLVDWRE